MATKHIYLSDLHFDHKVWTRTLTFFKEELELYNGYLAEVASRWTDKEVKAELEHFQNQFHIQNNHLDTLIHEIKVHEEALVKYAKEHETAIDHVYFDDHSKHHEATHDKEDTFKKIYDELKVEFKKFLSKYL